MEFKHFAQAVNRTFTKMSEHELFVTQVDPDALWAHYLASFPAGTNPVYLVNTEHDCSCCRNFIKHLGSLVCVANGKIETIWDDAALMPELGFYQEVAAAMKSFLFERPIASVFRTSEPSYGAEQTKQYSPSLSTPHTWNHFWGKVAKRHHTTSPGESRGKADAMVQVFHRGLSELTAESLNTIAELINTNSIYRGEEHKATLESFASFHNVYRMAKTPLERTLIVLNGFKAQGAQFRNTVIGTLAIDLSMGMDLESAVKAFESKVAPANYKRPKSLITPRMVQDATKTIQQLGLEEALPRRMATIRDITINNVLWAGRPASALMKGGVLDNLMQETRAASQDVGSALNVDVVEFMERVLPTAESIELFVRNHHQGNFVALTTAAQDHPPRLFKWDNSFGWSYDGNVADSIRDRVKTAGGKVDVPLRVSLSWNNYDDLDLHSTSPDGFCWYCDRKGILDVDANAGGGTPSRGTRTPVENQAWSRPKSGHYSFVVNQYRRMELNDVGFTLELACGTDVRQYSYKNAVAGMIDALKFDYDHITGTVKNVRVHKDMIGTGLSVKKWGVDTETFVPVRAVTYSPNYWDGQGVGNRHWFFFLENCGPELAVRGLYNEFLRGDLDQHRKVFEVLGDKTQCTPVPEQLAGLGFSSTKADSVTLRVSSGGRNTLYTVSF
jgi:hypothetical protein